MPAAQKYFIMIALVVAPHAAFADTSWVCSITNLAESQVLSKYTIEGGALVDNTNPALKYTLLQNNDYSIIATTPAAELEAAHDKQQAKATTLIINKKTMNYTVIYSPLQKGGNFTTEGDRTVNGNCIQN